MSSVLWQTYRTKRHFGSLDGLRFVCIGAVIWHHGPWIGDLETPNLLLTRGFLGVDFFFVISGFLITTLLLREQDAHGYFDLRHFYWRRLLRIVPIYFLVVAVNTLYAVFVQGQPEMLALLPYYLLFVSNFLTEHIPNLAVTWSLSVEEQYYLIWPLMLMLVPRRWIVPMLSGLITVNVLGHMGLLSWLGIPSMSFGPITLHLPPYAPILMGSVVAILLHSPHGFVMLEPVLARRGTILIGSVLLAIALMYLPGTVIGWPAFLIHCAMCVVLMSVVMREDHVLRWALMNRAVARIGQISYGMYLYHLMFLTLGYKILDALGLYSAPALFFFYFALTVVAAEISFRTIEAWFAGFRPRLRPRWAQKAA